MRLDIYNGKTKAGVLEQTGVNRFEFTYVPGAAAAQAISLLMPVRPESWVHTELHPVFQVSLPEGYLRSVLTRIFSKGFDRFGDMELLSIAGANLVGCLAAVPEGSVPQDDAAAEPLDHLLGHSRERLIEHYLGTRARDSGVSGGFPKFLSKSPAAGTAAGAGAASATLAFERWIIKIDSDDAPCLSLNEFFGLTVARRAGLPVPDFFLSNEGTHIAIKRFDVGATGQRNGFEDMCALLGLGSAAKFSGSAERIIKTIGAYCAPALELQKARAQFFAQYVLASTIRNGDAHLKNFGLVYDDPGQARMAPVYDMLSMGIYAPKTAQGDALDTMALSFNGTKRWLTGAAIDALADRCLLSHAGKDAIISRIVAAVRETAAEVAGRVRTSPAQFGPSGCRMLELWAHGAAAIDASLAAHVRGQWVSCCAGPGGNFPPK